MEVPSLHIAPLPLFRNAIAWIVILTLLSCSASKKLPDNNWDYNTFRNQQKSFTSKDGTIKYVDEGQGKVILLLHGVPSSSWLYRKMIPELVENGYRVIAPDMLGFGSSDNPKDYETYSPMQHANRILELMDYLHINQWVHVMHDAGGLWTMGVIDQAPNKISNLIVLNSVIYDEGFNPPIKMKRGVFSHISMWMYKNSITTNFLVKQLFKKTLKENILTKNEIEGYKKPLKEGKTNGMYHFFTKTCQKLPDCDTIIRKLDIPVQVIWGKHDDMLQWDPQKKLVIEGLKINEKNVHLIDARHFIQEEMPATIDSLILDFINRH